jgi:hypothetical protein
MSCWTGRWTLKRRASPPKSYFKFTQKK